MAGCSVLFSSAPASLPRLAKALPAGAQIGSSYHKDRNRIADMADTKDKQGWFLQGDYLDPASGCLAAANGLQLQTEKHKRVAVL